MKRRDLISTLGLSVFGAGIPAAKANAQSRSGRYSGTTLKINIPAHPHYDAMMKILPSFTDQTGIKVHVDRQPTSKLKELQLAELAKPQGTFDLIAYVVMWKGEYVKKGLIHGLEPFFQNSALADPNYDIEDIAPTYLENIGLVGGWRGYLNGPSAKLYGLPYGAETSILAYRKDIFEKLDIHVPATYLELERLLPILRERSGLGALSSRGKIGHQCVHAWLLHLNPMSGKIFDVQWKARFNDRIGVRALKFLETVMQTGPQGATEFGYSEMAESFL